MRQTHPDLHYVHMVRCNRVSVGVCLAVFCFSFSASAQQGGPWISIGPRPIVSYGASNSGRVWAIAADPRSSATVYAGTDGGGVWKSTDSGATWAPLTDSQTNLNVRDLALAPSLPDTVYAATAGGGILKSTNAGGTWTTVFAGQNVHAVAVHPSNPAILLAAAPATVSRSSDGGSTWTVTLTGQGSATQVLFDPSNGNIAYAAGGNGLYRSGDAGLTWNAVAGAGLPAGPYGGATVAIAPSAANLLYLALQGADLQLIGFYCSSDSGAHWTAIAAPPDSGAAGEVWSLRVHPNNPNVVYAGASHLSLTTDGGMTWQNVDNGLHTGHHAQAFSADGSRLYVGCDGGMWSNSAPTSPSAPWTNLNATLVTTMFQGGFSISPVSPGIAFGGAADNGTLRYQAGAWTSVACQSGGYTAIDPGDPRKVYAACASVQVLASADGGSTFQPAQTGIAVQDAAEPVPPLAMDPANAGRLYFGTNRLYQSSDGAATWTAISGDLAGSPGRGIAAIAVAPTDANTVYTGSGNGRIYVTRNALAGAAATWTERSIPGAASVAKIAVDPQDPLTAWAAAVSTTPGTGGLFLTGNGGVSWTSLSQGLGRLQVYDIVIDPDLANTLYAATGTGVYRSTDNGQSWLLLGSGLPNTPVRALALQRTSRTLRAATWGRGMWDLAVPAAGQVAVTIASSPAGRYFSVDGGGVYQAPLTFYWAAGATHSVTWLAAPPGTAGARYVFQSWTDGFGSNTRGITTPGTPTTYTANVKAQFQLSLSVLPAATGGASASPASADGYYDDGSAVTLTASPASGYRFLDYTGGVFSASSSQTVALSAAMSVTANFRCDYVISSTLPDTFGPGPTSGWIRWQTGAGCSWSASSDSPWLTLGTPASGYGSGAISYSIAQNTGAQRYGVLSFETDLYHDPTSITQNAPGDATPSVVSVSPASGSGDSGDFTFQFYDPNGYQNLTYGQLTVRSIFSGNTCQVYYSLTANQLWLNLYDPVAGWLGPLILPSSTSLENTNCRLHGAQSSLSGGGNLLNLTLSLEFLPDFAGDKIVDAFVYDSTHAAWAPVETVGTWTVPGAGAPASLAIWSKHAGNLTQGQPNAIYTLNVTNQAGAGATGGTVTVTETLPPGLSLVSMSGTGWSCNGPVCTRSDSLAGGAGYPPITVTAAVASDAASPQVNVAGVSGGNSAPGDTADPATILAPFGDVSAQDYFFGAVDLMRGYSITAGCSSNPPRYCPGDNVTRAQMAIFIIRAILGTDNFSYSPVPYFSDVPSGAFGFAWIQKMYELHITAGCGNGNYCPAATVTRAQMATFVIRARLGAAADSTFPFPAQPYFSDVPAGSMYFKWVQRMKLDQVTAGCGDGTAYCPDDPVTRGQMAIFLMRGAFNLLLSPGVPMVSALDQNLIARGQSLTVTLFGANTHFQAGVTVVSAGSGVTAGPATISGDGTLQVQLTAAADAEPGPRTITVTTGAELAILPNGLTVQ